MKKVVATGVALLALGLGGCTSFVSDTQHQACVAALDVADSNQAAMAQAGALTAQGATDALEGDYDTAIREFDAAQQLLEAVDVDKYNDYAKECRG